MEVATIPLRTLAMQTEPTAWGVAAGIGGRDAAGDGDDAVNRVARCHGAARSAAVAFRLFLTLHLIATLLRLVDGGSALDFQSECAG